MRAFSFSTGIAYYMIGRGKDLGSNLLFRSGAELGYRFDNASRLSVVINHMSHATLLGNKNPGTEVIGITYTIPFSGFW